ncbi:hypothetical protein [Pseudomonas simiae]|uniref:hypothetical protein n=1 Tax=Pseudomonas simiae TaxID=321846 RepID=UPI0018E77DF0|nr:hypothetical protein [Pseudomonas simiae]MBJ2228811.1 hypothetical protein [Pseudomonas simiae]WLG72651.1 hypothetical protein PSH60_21175 [Pseudomonas simiae]
MSVLLGQDGVPVEKQWAAFVEMDECQIVAKTMTNYFDEYKRKSDDALVFRCNKPKLSGGKGSKK